MAIIVKSFANTFVFKHWKVFNNCISIELYIET